MSFLIAIFALHRRDYGLLAYLARYTHRVAISNSPLIALDEAGVTFKWKTTGSKARDRFRTMTLDAAEFIRRFLLHVLPSGFPRIRHMWTASWQVVFDALIALVGCGHMLDRPLGKWVSTL